MSSFNVELFAMLGILLLVCYKSSHVFKYYVKTGIIHGYLALVSLLAIAICICTFRRRNVKNFLILAYLAHPISRPCGVNWILRGKEYLEKEGTCIFVVNHQTALDLLGLNILFSAARRCGVVAKKEILYFFPCSAIAWLCGITFIDRKNFEKSSETLQKTIEEFKPEGNKLLIFAEGRRRNTGEIHQFKKGAFHLAINAQVPIYPIVYSRHYFFDEANKHFDTGNIIITALPPIPTQGMTSNDVNDLIARTREAMIKVFDETSKEALNM